SQNCQKKRSSPGDRQTQQLYQRFQLAQFRNYQAPINKPKPVNPNKLTPNTTDQTNKVPLKQHNDPKNPYTNPKPINITPKQPINKPNPPPTFQSNKPKQPFNNKNEETLDASIHAHSSWADDYDHNYNYHRPNDNNDQNEQPDMLTKISNQLETIAS
ncbi:9974_t:CDS:1, partial [Funneliformis caledonium]